MTEDALYAIPAEYQDLEWEDDGDGNDDGRSNGVEEETIISIDVNEDDNNINE